MELKKITQEELDEVLKERWILQCSRGKKGSYIQLKYEGMDLKGLDFSCSDLRSLPANEFKKFMPDWRVEDCYHLQPADLSFTNFSNADLEGANFKKTKLLYTNFQGANLKNADFSHLMKSDFLYQTRIDETTNLTDTKFYEFNKS
jgi:uncharacterized protein YjbI with pentapeptide repeats